jgi:phosphatidylinositol-4-phosphate 3-kinase
MTFLETFICCFQVSEGSELPDPYVKMYLLPDSAKQTKRKTEIARKSNNPTFNEMVSI